MQHFSPWQKSAFKGGFDEQAEMNDAYDGGIQLHIVTISHAL
jgi:hypothetical protein